ncbi:MAG: helix-turn-helix transcriptional regulator [Sulfurimonas sp.]|jgi:transcriptional regulator with XRE-family HTH domain|nr:helix-turn-helix transcriptional regulator [Sulfurimonadaceae bacterium]
MLAISLSTPNTILQTIKENFKQKRLQQNLTQEGLATRSGVSLGSIKRFETTGKISLEFLLNLALVLNCLDDFKDLAKQEQKEYKTIDDLLKTKPTKKRGAIK